ncbi:regulatory protein RecX [Granulosicoccus sp. 3-233]|uniref:regulatory protein RecX n=1 Tax=Granulosicoccus sp. 3-233 TaxID=3417969 RepID=UPI003D345992
MSQSETPEELARKAAHQAYVAAIRLLAKRDHSTAELTRKLQQREHDEQAIEEALADLVSANYLNDARYAELYAEQRMNHGYGPLSIRSKLAERGIDSHLVQRALRSLQVDWSEQAEMAIARRFSPQDIADTDQQAVSRIARFLQRRGYSSSDALQGLRKLRKEQARSSAG